MKAIGFNQGQFGDLCMNIVACKSFKNEFPDSKLYFGINKKYESLKDIFLYNQYIDDIHIWDKYDGWPSKIDKDYMDQENFDKVFNPMPKHTEESWYLNRHQTEEVCLMHGLQPPSDLKINLNKYFETSKNLGYVAVNFSAATRAENKTLSESKIKDIIELLIKLGYKPIQIGLPEATQFAPEKYIGTFFDTIKFVLSCDFLLTIDSAINWIASGYEFPTIGLYTPSYYPGAYTSKNWQPINKNAIYLENKNINNISLDTIKVSVENI